MQNILYKKVKDPSEICKLVFIDFHNASNLNSILDEHIISICKGRLSQDLLPIVKLEIYNYLKDKEEKKKIGAVAEFFAHLYFNNEGFTQECQFFNLEELSAKKGFDGYYTFLNEDWILESKSRNFTTDVSHNNNLKIAYSDLNKKLLGKDSSHNNPWRNAYNHAMHGDVGSSKSIQDKLKKLSQEYATGFYYDTSNFNIIPCSTIFYTDTNKIVINDFSAEQILKQIKNTYSKMKYKKIILLAISNSVFNDFMNYINEGLSNE